MDNIKIRKATLEDCEIIASINNEHILKGVSSMETELKSKNDFIKLMNNFNVLVSWVN